LLLSSSPPSSSSFGEDNVDFASPQFDVTDFQASRLHRLHGASGGNCSAVKT
jgi:hypothetical protein